MQILVPNVSVRFALGFSRVGLFITVLWKNERGYSHSDLFLPTTYKFIMGHTKKNPWADKRDRHEQR